MPEVLDEPIRVQSQQAPALKPQLPQAVEAALAQLVVANQLRELASYPKPVTLADAARIPRPLVRFLQRIYASGHRRNPTSRPATWLVVRSVLVDAGVLLVVRLWLVQGRVWRLGRETLGSLVRNAVYHQMRYHAQPASAITGYVHGGQSETVLIRMCLLLRVIGRHGACVELLVRRLRSAFQDMDTRQWLAICCREAGDSRTAEWLLSGDAPPTAENGRALSQDAALPPVARLPQGRLKYGLVLCAMYDSPVFRSSLSSVLASDFPGQVVVVEDGHQPLRACEAFCQSVGVTYVKNATWGGPTGTMHLGLQHLDAGTDIAIFSHSDVLYPPEWFRQLNDAWEQVYDTNKVGIINLGNVQFPGSADPVLKELFARGRYRDLAWILRTRREIPPHMDQLFDVQNTDLGRRFGLGRDNWGDRPAALQVMTGKFSAGASFQVALWKELGGFDLDMAVGFDMELQVQCCRTKRWNLWINNTPLIHLVSSDSARFTGTERTRWGQLNRQSYERFPQRYGWTVDHFYWTVFSEVRVLYEEQIVEAVSNLRFVDVDFIFDEIDERLKRKTLATCEFVWCQSRRQCPYGESAT